jgi:hypothetical protein
MGGAQPLDAVHYVRLEGCIIFRFFKGIILGDVGAGLGIPAKDAANHEEEKELLTHRMKFEWSR